MTQSSGVIPPQLMLMLEGVKKTIVKSVTLGLKEKAQAVIFHPDLS